MYKFIFLIQLIVLSTIISSSNAGFWDSLVNVDRSDNGDKKVGVHLPFIYWMDLNRNKEGPKLDISVLGGLVKVNVDRNKTHGKRPVMVRLLGQKLYNSYPNGASPTNGLFGNYQQASYEGQETNGIVINKPYDTNKPSETNKQYETAASDYKPDKVATETVTEPKYDIPPSAVTEKTENN